MDYIEQLKRKSEKMAIAREKAASTPYYNDERVQRMEKFQKTVKNYKRTGMHNKAALGFPVFIDNTNKFEKEASMEIKPLPVFEESNVFIFTNEDTQREFAIIADSYDSAMVIVQSLDINFSHAREMRGIDIIKTDGNN